ncbi:epidermal differentiation-specific protein-like [Aquarana catesbeiana]|uniref:epidermal differentiation-specific protein-like n=1 Tax=Aquarana catesbeiana TaxID=8400 RepID=UPI003CCA3139
MNLIQLYPHQDYRGESVTINEDNPNLSTLGILKTTQSLVVSGDPWIVYSDINYQGAFKCFKAGNYSTLSLWGNKIKSVRVVKGGLDNPGITLYEDVNYEGRAVVLKAHVDSLKTHDFDKKALSHKVTQGAWILYSADAFSGDKMIMLMGDEVPDYSEINWQNKLSSLEPAVGGDG